MPKIATALNFSPIPVGLSGMQQFIHLSELLECSDEPCRAAGVYTLLWNFACSSNPRKDGAFRPMASCSLARICGWDGDADLLRGALLESGVISVRGDNWSLSGWEIYAEVAIKNRKKATEKKRGQRAKSPKQADRHNKSDSMSPGTSPGQDAGHPEGPFARKDKVQAKDKDKDKDNGGGVSHTGAKPSAAEAQVGSGQAPPPRASQPSAAPESTQTDNGHADKGSPPSASPAATQAPRRVDEPDAPAEVAPAAQQAPPPAAAQALVVARPVSLAAAEEPPPHGEMTTRPVAIAVAVPLSKSPDLVEAYEADRREWMSRRVTSVPHGVPLSAGQLTLTLCQDLHLGIDVHIREKHKKLIGGLSGKTTAAHVQQAWADTVTAVSANDRDNPGLGLMLKILGRVTLRAIMPENCDDWVLRAAKKQLTFEKEAMAELRRREAADPNYYDVPAYRSQKW